jgi:hypothetical protein
MNEDLINASVTVPRVRLADLHEFAAKLLREESRQTNGMGPGHGAGDFVTAPEAMRPGGVAKPSVQEWRADDVEVAAEVMRSSMSDHVRAAWRALAASGPQNRLTGVEMDRAVGIEGRRRNGVLSRMVASCRVRNRVGPWHWDPTNNTYWMGPTEAEIFTQALVSL